MRAALALLTALAVLPLAAADQSISAGPATVSTLNSEYGDGCEGTNGGAQRDVRAHVDDPRPNGGTKDVVIGSSCNSYDDGSIDFESSSVYVYYADYQFGQPGPSLSYGWYGGSSNGSSWCASYVASGSVVQYLGCPSPEGSAPPALPVLP